MSAYDRHLAAPYADAVEPPEPTDEQLERAIDSIAERGGNILLTDLFDEGFFLDNLRSVIVAKTPAAQAKACAHMRTMFSLLHGARVKAESQRIADADMRAERDRAAEYAAECARDAA